MKYNRLSSRLSLTEARSLVKDLSRPNPWIYWSDFLASILVGHVLFIAGLNLHRWLDTTTVEFWAVRVGVFAINAVLYMRAAMFIHELVHLGSNFNGFRFAWNALCGIPFLMPSFLYYPHIDHHRRKSYGTAEDGEYLDLSHRHPVHIVGFILSGLVVPVVALLRFLVLTPLAWVWPELRSWVTRHASSMVIDIFYLRGDFGTRAHRMMRIQECLCFAWAVSLFCTHPVTNNSELAGFWSQAYFMGVALLVINNVRTLGAHRWVSQRQEEMSFEAQLLDSVNYPHRPWITELWGPVGTRFHALHHLFPTIPYHNLGSAHRRLMANLPANSLYRETNRVSLVYEIWQLWSRASQKQAQPKQVENQQVTAA